MLINVLTRDENQLVVQLTLLKKLVAHKLYFLVIYVTVKTCFCRVDLHMYNILDIFL